MGNNAPNPPSSSVAGEPESLEQLIGDCRRMAPRWTAPASASRPPAAPGFAAAKLHGITVQPASAHVVDGMAEYGD